jgi:ABC-type transport system involved in multi-copper enzyme maturation permease subunit
MSSDQNLQAVVKSEWIKFRSVRSSVMGVSVFFVLTLGLGGLISWAVRSHWSQTSYADKVVFDPVSTSLAGILFAQFAVGVICVLFITSEYSSGSIRTTLAAVPNRIRLVSAKLIVLLLSIIVVSEIVCFATFLLGQAVFKGVVPTASLGTADVLRSVLLAGLYLTLLTVLGFSLGLIVRQSAACISIFVSVLLILPIIFVFLPTSWQNSYEKYFPSELGRSMMSPFPSAHHLGAWNATVVLLIYTAVVFGAGLTLMRRRDA